MISKATENLSVFPDFIEYTLEILRKDPKNILTYLEVAVEIVKNRKRAGYKKYYHHEVNR